jgi:hypothetical protein
MIVSHPAFFSVEKFFGWKSGLGKRASTENCCRPGSITSFNSVTATTGALHFIVDLIDKIF